MPTIIAFDREGEKHEVKGENGRSVMETLRDAGLPIEAACGGCCSCATCHVYVDEAWWQRLGSREDTEQDLLSMSDHLKDGASRLSCQIRLSSELDGLTVTLAPED